MNKLCEILKIENEDLLFKQITSTFKEKGILLWDYFVNWEKVQKNIKVIEKELNLLNVLIGKENIEKEVFELIKEYPQVIKAFPFLIAFRDNKVSMLTDVTEFLYKDYDFKHRIISDEDCEDLTTFFMQSGLGNLMKDKHIKNLVDYVTGVEVGLDSNGRKNRGGTMMEKIVETFVKNACEELGLLYMTQANAKKIKTQWDIEIQVDKSSRNLDFAINKNGKLYFIECNFYGGGGSKLKSTATEYVKMNEYWNAQNITFIWVTDGAGWKSTLKPLREYFDKADYLLNLEMLKKDCLKKII
ncbi:type II deoxyribonuclease [Flavobacterium branchiophilum]|uniref:Type-2 restriction enzyme n=1 Tax=Flavobacterium branchiophilum TaxID=55197 RepID=A0A543G0I1_9FLAO|nr:type II restriction endonuclease [Flavobacterium branchiophilum]OXA75116.1 type II deoxyribonuclease [Flavobacterium branchiophilum] [Flavobacterium branchiophilum NBRC 15030 = ATCC 35035]TQM39596.1 type II restriction enzyme [Flavobacterium branchiophilum]GEM56492.1 type II restriction endonuclease MjaIII [Flavobacterium branchiophilum NBRC 15030 = ATCC 35035]